MPTIYSHGIVGLGAAGVALPRCRSWLFWTLAAFLPMVPDFDAFSTADYRSCCVPGHWDATDAKASPVVQLAAFHQQEATRPSAKPSNWRRAKKRQCQAPITAPSPSAKQDNWRTVSNFPRETPLFANL